MRSNDHRRQIGRDMWPGLGQLREVLDRHPIEQVVGPDSPAALARHLVQCITATMRVVRQLGSTPLVEDGELAIDLRAHAWPLAKLVTIDVARARAGAHAAEVLLARRDMRGSTVVFSGSASANVCAADTVLQHGGVRTLELWHGAGSDVLFGNPESNSAIRCVWTEPDAEVFRQLGRPTIVGGMPYRAPALRKRKDGEPINALILTSYCHNDIRHNGSFPLECFSRELLDIPAILPIALCRKFHFRWRPHPAEDRRTVERIKPSKLELSNAESFESDLAWSDLVIANQSTTVVEALLARRIVFVHVLPLYSDGPNALAIAAERRFFRAPDIAVPLAGCVSVIEGDGVEAALEPERRALEKTFGETRAPASFTEALAEIERCYGLRATTHMFEDKPFAERNF